MTPKPRLLVTRRMPPAVEARAARDYDAVLNPTDTPYPPDALVEKAEGADALLISGNRLNAEVIERLPPSVRAVATFSVGLDHIDLPAARRRGLVVSNTPDVLTDATADTAMLLILAAARRASEGERLVREGRWTGLAPTAMLGIDVTGKRLGIVGMGRIGQALARRARGFAMTVLYHNRRPLPPEREEGARYFARIEEMLPHCDIVSVNAPSTPETYHLIDAERLALLPDGAVLVNTARGELVDDAALIAALRSGKLFAAGLDVFEGEPRINPGYRELDNVFLLPHLGSATIETRTAMGMRCLDNLDAFFAGREPPNRVA